MSDTTPCHTRRRRRLLATALLFGCPALALAGPAFDAARVGWSEIRMGATKLFLSAESTLAWRLVPGDSVAGDLVSFPPGEAVAPGPEVLELSYLTAGVGRKSSLTLLMDPASGAAIQRLQHEYEGKFRYRVYRFGDIGAFHRTRHPASNQEKTLPPGKWTKTGEGLRRYPVLPGTTPVVEPTGLLYLIAAAELDQPGDTLDVLTFRRRDTQTVRVTVLPPREITVRYDELWPSGAVQRRGTLRPVRLALEGVATPGQPPDGDDLELLGLRGRLELLLDPETRAPVELSGNVRILGTVTLRLLAVRPL